MEITKAGDLENLKKGEVIELPPFDEKNELVARLKRPSLLTLCRIGTIPNKLLTAAQRLFEGDKKGDIKEYGELLHIVAEAALVEPKYEDVKDLLTDEQLTAIFNYTQLGVMALQPFRELRRKAKELAKGINSSKGK